MLKQNLIFMFGVLLCYGMESCKPDPTLPDNARLEEEVDLWPKDSVMKMVNRSLWRVQNVYHVNGKDTVNLADIGFENRYFQERHEVIFAFYTDYLAAWFPGKAQKDTEGKFRKPAEIHLFNDRSLVHSNVYHRWNDSLNTLELLTAHGNIVNIPGGTAFLEKSKLVIYKSYQEEERAAKPSCMLYRTETEFGTYLFELRQVWRFETHPDYLHFDYYVVFP